MESLTGVKMSERCTPSPGVRGEGEVAIESPAILQESVGSAALRRGVAQRSRRILLRTGKRTTVILRSSEGSLAARARDERFFAALRMTGRWDRSRLLVGAFSYA